MATKSMVRRVRLQDDSVDKRESRSRGGLPSSNGPTVRSWRFSHRASDTLTYSAGRDIN